MKSDPIYGFLLQKMGQKTDVASKSLKNFFYHMSAGLPETRIFFFQALNPYDSTVPHNMVLLHSQETSSLFFIIVFISGLDLEHNGYMKQIQISTRAYKANTGCILSRIWWVKFVRFCRLSQAISGRKRRKSGARPFPQIHVHVHVL